MKILFTSFSAASAALLALASTTSAQLVISNMSPTVIDFENEVPGVWNADEGSTGMRDLMEPGGWDNSPTNPNERGGLLTTGATVSQNTTGPYLFAEDADSSSEDDDFFNFNGFGPESSNPTIGTMNTHLVFGFVEGQAWSDVALYLRVQNSTGAAQDTWQLGADLWASGSGGNQSDYQLVYAVDNGNDPSAMSFTTVNTIASTTDTGNTTTDIADMSESISATVADGDYIVFAIQEINRSSGGGSLYLDNLSVAVPEPGTYAAIAGLGALAIAFLRRRR